MQLTRFTDLALRIVMRLAVTDNGPTPSNPTTRQVADELVVPYTHAAKVVARLNVLGVVETRRGRGGGLHITESGRNASIGRLARELEGEHEVIDCEGDNPCPLSQVCRLRHALARAKDAFFAELDLLTVEDLTAPPTRSVLLSLTAPPSR